MPLTLTAEDAKQSLTAHVTTKGEEIHRKVRPAHRLERIATHPQRPRCVRYPCEIIFDEKPLNAGEFAYPVQKGNTLKRASRCTSIPC
jgi:hypothetical protein